MIAEDSGGGSLKALAADSSTGFLSVGEFVGMLSLLENEEAWLAYRLDCLSEFGINDPLELSWKMRYDILRDLIANSGSRVGAWVRGFSGPLPWSDHLLAQLLQLEVDINHDKSKGKSPKVPRPDDNAEIRLQHRSGNLQRKADPTRKEKVAKITSVVEAARAEYQAQQQISREIQNQKETT